MLSTNESSDSIAEMKYGGGEVWKPTSPTMPARDNAEKEEENHQTEEAGRSGNASAVCSRGRDVFERYYRQHYWTAEVVCLGLCVLVICIMSGVLARFDGQVLSTWTASLTLNSFVSLGVTMLYLLLMAVISSSLSQQKWAYFSGPRALYDFHAYHEASRSLRGALNLLLVKQARTALTGLAVLLILVVAAIGPLVQQIVDVEIINVKTSTSAMLPIAHSLDMGTLFGSEHSQLANSSQPNVPENLDAASAVYSGIFSTSSAGTNSINPSCNAGNCAWDRYATLAVRSRCVNVTDHLILPRSDALVAWLAHAGDSTNVSSNSATSGAFFSTLPNLAGNQTSVDLNKAWTFLMDQASLLYSPPLGIQQTSSPTSVKQFKGNFTSAWINTSPSLLSLQQSNSSLGSFQLIYQEIQVSGGLSPNGLQNAQIRYGGSLAYECQLDIVAQSMQATQVDGVFSETPVGDVMEFAAPGASSLRNRTTPLGIWWDNQTLTIDPAAVNYLSSSVQPRFLDSSGLTTWSFGAGWPSAGENIGARKSYNSEVAATLHARLASQVGQGSSGGGGGGGAPAVFDSVARSLTTQLRHASGQTAAGTASAPQPVYRVRWGWLALPIVLTALAAALVGATARQSRRAGVPAWAGSALAMLVHGVDDGARRHLARLADVEDLVQESKLIQVQLQGDERMLNRSWN